MSDIEDYSSESDNESVEPQPKLKIGKATTIDAADELVDESDNDSVVESDDDSVIESDDDEEVETHEQLDRGTRHRAGEGDEEPMNLEGYNEDISDGSDNDVDSEEDEDADYLQKFEKDIQRKVIEEFHPDLQIHNNDEIETLCKIVRDSNGQIIDPFHKTSTFVTRYEKARILGERAKQINAGAEPFVEVEPDMMDGYLIALKEFESKKLPFIVQRPLPNGACEYWRLSDLEIL